MYVLSVVAREAVVEVYTSLIFHYGWKHSDLAFRRMAHQRIQSVEA